MTGHAPETGRFGFARRGLDYYPGTIPSWSAAMDGAHVRCAS
jgi:hypothetical protein